MNISPPCQFSRSVVSDSLWPHGLQHARPPCPSPTPRACSDSCPSSRWCHPTILSSVVPFSSCLQCFPASGSFPMSQFFASGGQNIGVSASASALPMNIPDWFPLGWTGWISLQSKRLSRVFSNTTVQKHQFFGTQLSLWYNSHIHTFTTGKTIVLTRLTFVGKVMALLFNMLSRLVIAFLSRSKASFNFMIAVTIWSDFGAPKSKVCHCFHCFLIYLPWSDGTRCHDLFECWDLSQLFHSPLSRSSWGSLVHLCFLPQEWCHLHISPGNLDSSLCFIQPGISHDVLYI